MTSAWEVNVLAANSILPAVMPHCRHSDEMLQRMQMQPKDLVVGPWFAVPLAAMVYAQDSGVDALGLRQTNAARGLVLMYTAEGAPSQRVSAPFGCHDWTKISKGAHLEGRAMALLHLPHLKDNQQDVLGQPSWCHGDLHYGNVFIDSKADQVHYLDFEKMRSCRNWFDEAQATFGTYVSAEPKIYELANKISIPPGSCLQVLNAWLEEPTNAQALADLDRAWLADQRQFVAFAQGYLTFVPQFARADLEVAFDQACRRGLHAPAAKMTKMPHSAWTS